MDTGEPTYSEMAHYEQQLSVGEVAAQLERHMKEHPDAVFGVPAPDHEAVLAALTSFSKGKRR